MSEIQRDYLKVDLYYAACEFAVLGGWYLFLKHTSNSFWRMEYSVLAVIFITAITSVWFLELLIRVKTLE